MKSKESVVRLLLVTDRLEEAEQITSILRNGGMAVRPTRAESAEHLEDVVENHPTDLVVVEFSGKQIPLKSVVELVKGSGKDIPIVAIANEYSDQAVLDAYATGCSRIASRGKSEILQRVIGAEFTSLDTRRAVRRLEAALRESEKRCDSLIDSSHDPVAYIHEGMHIRANLAYLEMFGFEEFADVEGLTVLDLIAPSHADSFKQLLRKLSKGEPPPKTLQVDAQRADGGTFEATMEFTQATYEGEPCLQIVFRQRTIDAEVVAELDSLRNKDQATGLFNRQYFLTELDEAVAEAAKGQKDQALLLIELDNYAALLNEIGLGHADELLKSAARRLSESAGQATIARFGDHTFGLLLRKCDHTVSRERADAIRAGFAGKILEAAGKSVSVSVCVGGVQMGEKIASTQQVLAKAAQCLNAAASMGGNRTEIFDPAARDRAEEERMQERIKQVEEALENSRFVLLFQPIISLHGDGGECYEVLVRMKLPNGELVQPESFLPDGEEHGLMARIDRWTIGRALALLAERQKAGKQTKLFVNITTHSLLDEQLPNLIGNQVKKLGVNGSLLVLEIPESKVYTNLKPAQEFRRAIAQYGCALSLEHFGSGVNSFQLLQHIDPEYLRIDHSYMSDLAKNPESQKKVREISDRATALGKKTIAEHVADAASMSVLFTSSVSLVSGNFLAPPSPDLNYDFG